MPVYFNYTAFRYKKPLLSSYWREILSALPDNSLQRNIIRTTGNSSKEPQCSARERSLDPPLAGLPSIRQGQELVTTTPALDNICSCLQLQVGTHWPVFLDSLRGLREAMQAERTGLPSTLRLDSTPTTRLDRGTVSHPGLCQRVRP